MKTLLILRHAKSDYPPDVAQDFDRPLNKRGRKDVPRMALLVRRCGLLPDGILSSPALRARQTAEGLAAELELPAQALRFDERLYLAAPDTLARASCHLPEEWNASLVVAHNPGLQEWIERLCGARVHLPTTGLAAIDLGIAHWSALQEARGVLRLFATPRLVKALT